MIMFFIVALWLGVIISFYLFLRESKKKENVFKYRIEELEERLKMIEEKDSASSDRIVKINRMAAELLDVLQEKENDIHELMDKFDNMKEVAMKRPLDNVKKVSFGQNNEGSTGGLSVSERHVMEMLKRRSI